MCGKFLRMARAPDTLKPYQPTLRNRISTALLGDAKASSVRGRFVKGLMGDTGLSATGLGIVDLLPFLQADEAGRQLATKGQRAAGAGNLALSVIPIPAVANKLVKPAVKKAAKGVSRLIGDVVGEAAPTVSKIADAMEGAAPIKATTPLDAIMDRAKAQGVDLYVSQGNDGLRLSKIVVPKDQRGQGVGSAVMGDLLDYADTTGQRVTLTPSDAFGGSVPRLKKFYGAHDFTPNAGRTRDFSTQDTMIRNPKPKAPIPVPVVGGPPRNAEGFSAPLDMSQEARMARAAEQGFGKTYYHGSPDLSGEIDTSLGGGSLGQGLYVTRMKDRASSYAGSEGAVYPVKLRGEVLDLGTPEGRAIFDTMPIEELRRQFDVIRAPGESTALKDATVRSAFDPFHPGGEARVGLPRPGDYKVGGSLPPVPVVMPRSGGAATQPAPVVQPKITAYHGSPHDFDQFSLDKIGTGEGAQAYGHGLYFAENEAVAKGYRDQISGDGLVRPDGAVWKPSGLRHMNVRVEANRNGADLDATIAKAQSLLPNAPPATRPLLEADIAELMELRDSGGVKANPGSMYQVGIDADPEHFLDWEKPLSEQSDAYRQRLDAALKHGDTSIDEIAGVARTDEDAGKLTGETIYDVLGRFLESPEAATSALQRGGIPGIKYLDQGSRGAGEGTRNFVVFDEKLITILKKYGWVPGAALPAAAIAEYTKENGSPPPTVPMV